MPSLCCLFCPAADFSPRSLEDTCGTCGRTYGFPLSSSPDEIGGYKVLRPLARGFYSATYVAERKSGLRSKCVLKVSPKSFYSFFPNKDFHKECLAHESVAEGSEHLVKIRDMGEASVSFAGEVIACFFAELDYVEGPLLSDFLDG